LTALGGTRPSTAGGVFEGLAHHRAAGASRGAEYLAERGFVRDVLLQQRVGFAAGDELISYLAWRGLRVSAARRVGLLRADGRESLAGRIVFPEVRQRQPIWLIGRLLQPSDDLPRYLGLPGPKPLLGWDQASRDRRGVCLVEGPLDLLTLQQWGIPGLALCGTGFSPATLELLRLWERLYAVLDADPAGQEATTRLANAFGSRLISVGCRLARRTLGTWRRCQRVALCFGRHSSKRAVLRRQQAAIQPCGARRGASHK
jgi:DNA primase